MVIAVFMLLVFFAVGDHDSWAGTYNIRKNQFMMARVIAWSDFFPFYSPRLLNFTT